DRTVGLLEHDAVVELFVLDGDRVTTRALPALAGKPHVRCRAGHCVVFASTDGGVASLSTDPDGFGRPAPLAAPKVSAAAVDVDVSADGTRLAVSSRRGTILVHHVGQTSDRVIADPACPSPQWVRFDADDQTLFYTCFGDSFAVRRAALATGELSLIASSTS